MPKRADEIEESIAIGVGFLGIGDGSESQREQQQNAQEQPNGLRVGHRMYPLDQYDFIRTELCADLNS